MPLRSSFETLPGVTSQKIGMIPNPTFSLEYLLKQMPDEDIHMFATLKSAPAPAPTQTPAQAPKQTKQRKPGQKKPQKKRQCLHGKRPERCHYCGGHAFCIAHGIRKEICKECGGASICEHGRERRMCKECLASGKGGTSLCPLHLVRKSSCKKCKSA